MGAERVRTQPGSYDAKVVSKQPLDQTKSARDQAQSQLQALQAQVGQETRFDFNRCRLDFLS